MPTYPHRRNIYRRVRQVVADPDFSSQGDRLLTTPECADWLGVSVSWLNHGRIRNYGPKWMRLSQKLVRYKVSDVLDWLEDRGAAA